MELTMVQALRLLKTLREEQTQAIDDVPKASMPIRVDSASSVPLSKEFEVSDTLTRIVKLTDDIVELRNAIDSSNKDHDLNGLVNELQETRKVNNRLDSMEDYGLRNAGKIVITENGNVIEHGMVMKEEYDEVRKMFKQRAEELQDGLDQVNSMKVVKVELKTR